MELLVVTLASTLPGRDTDVLARIRLISDTVNNAPGLITSHFYRSRGKDSYYLMLTAWEDDESWKKSQERHNPKQLLLTSAADILKAQPDQWLMHYLWGYSRPAAIPALAESHIATIRPNQADFVQQNWLQGLRRQASEPRLAFALLARGVREENVSLPLHTPVGTASHEEAPYIHGPILLGLFSWGTETEREEFYADPQYQKVNKFLSSVGVVRSILLEPF